MVARIAVAEVKQTTPVFSALKLWHRLRWPDPVTSLRHDNFPVGYTRGIQKDAAEWQADAGRVREDQVRAGRCCSEVGSEPEVSA